MHCRPSESFMIFPQLKAYLSIQNHSPYGWVLILWTETDFLDDLFLDFFWNFAFSCEALFSVVSFGELLRMCYSNKGLQNIEFKILMDGILLAFLLLNSVIYLVVILAFKA